MKKSLIAKLIAVVAIATPLFSLTTGAGPAHAVGCSATPWPVMWYQQTAHIPESWGEANCDTNFAAVMAEANLQWWTPTGWTDYAYKSDVEHNTNWAYANVIGASCEGTGAQVFRTQARAEGVDEWAGHSTDWVSGPAYNTDCGTTPSIPLRPI